MSPQNESDKEKYKEFGQYTPLRQQVETFKKLNEALIALDRYKGNLVPPLDLVEQIVRFVCESYTNGKLYKTGGEAHLFYAKTLLNTAVAIKIPKLLLPGSEGEENITIWDKAKNYLFVDQEDRASKRFLEGAKIQDAVNELLRTEKIDFFGVPKIINANADPLWIVMEWIPGKPVLDWMKVNHCRIFTAVQIFLKLIKGIAIIHENNIIHRDINPNNILLYDKNHVFLVDWSISKRIYDPTRTLTVKGVELGTGPYAPPSQIEKKKWQEATIQNDIYALGFTFVAFILGEPLPKPVNEKDTYSKLQAKFKTRILNNPMFPPIFHNIFDRATAWEDEKKYQSVNEMITDVEDLLYQLQNTQEGQEVIRMPDTIIPNYRFTPVSTTPQDAQPTPVAIAKEADIPTMVLPPPPAIPTNELDPLAISMVASELSQKYVSVCSKKNKATCSLQCTGCDEYYRALIRAICDTIARLKKGKYI